MKGDPTRDVCLLPDHWGDETCISYNERLYRAYLEASEKAWKLSFAQSVEVAAHLDHITRSNQSVTGK